MAMESEGLIRLGGCMVDWDSPYWHCSRCDHEWGHDERQAKCDKAPLQVGEDLSLLEAAILATPKPPDEWGTVVDELTESYEKKWQSDPDNLDNLLRKHL